MKTEILQELSSNIPEQPLYYQSEDKQYGVHIPPHVLERLKAHIAHARNSETGGIVLGNYNENRSYALVSSITDAPKDSKSGPTWFNRGTKGLNEILKKAWGQKRYYLGEWHFHPAASANSSGTDKMQMQNIAKDKNYNCPEPILLIIGGSPDLYEIKCWVFLRDGLAIQLLPVQSE